MSIKNGNNNIKQFNSQQSLNSYIKGICDIMRRSNCTSALQYVPELTWLLFLRILDDIEQQEAESMDVIGLDFTYSLAYAYRWQDWASPNGTKRLELTMSGNLGDFMNFVNGGYDSDGKPFGLLPTLKALKDQPNATPRQKIVSEVLSATDKVRIDSERNLLDVLDKVQEIRNVDDTHIFPISQVYEGLLLKMGEKNNDGGQFFTPREVIRAIVTAIDPQIGETVYDPASGTGGFLAQTYEHISNQLGDDITAEQLDTLKHQTFYGR
ncbi:N-6 DNA methylase, partial [Geminocystis sp.]|uniref:class I SAM-dependent DNA methyltransferase n=1 Tax=Geminocystis sp. TaxID=2664100 RepID=UPI0035934061